MRKLTGRLFKDAGSNQLFNERKSMRKFHCSLVIFYLVQSMNIVGASDVVEGRLDPNCSTTMVLAEVRAQARKTGAHGADYFVYPKEIPESYTGCQTTWLGNGHKLVTKHLERGAVTWLRGQEPKDVMPFFCLYKDGILNKKLSFNIKRCPN